MHGSVVMLAVQQVHEVIRCLVSCLPTHTMFHLLSRPVLWQVAQGTGLGPRLGADAHYAYTGSESGTPSSSGIPPPIHWPDEKKDNDAGGGGGDFDEVDIYVPSAPSAPPSGTPTSTIASPTTDLKPPHDSDKHDDNDDDDTQGQGGPPSASSGGPTYEDLAARFQMLKK
jgi:hypothetical protein